MMLFLSGCGNEPVRTSKTLLQPNEVRGEVISLDLNNSVVKVKALALGPGLEQKLSLQNDSLVDFVVQAGDMSLLQNKSLFKGKLQETFSTQSGISFLLHEVQQVSRGRVTSL